VAPCTRSLRIEHLPAPAAVVLGVDGLPLSPHGVKEVGSHAQR
jgi:hypothetical protein